MTETGADKLTAYTATRGLRGRRLILEPDDLLDRLAIDLGEQARRRVQTAGVFHLALSGGSTPQALYRRLMIDPQHRLFPWQRTHVWIVDDRCVEPDDDRYNSKMIRELIADHADIPASHFHPMPVLEPDGDRRYERELRAALAERGVDDRLDAVLLGMGGDTHTASLFPQTPGLNEFSRWVIFNDGELVASPRPRMTMTFAAINAARWIGVLVTGQSKHAPLVRVAAATAAGDDVQHLPITGVRPAHEDGEMVWYLDAAAASGAEPIA